MKLLFAALVTVPNLVVCQADPAALPKVPRGFEVTLFAKEPLVRNPVSMAFDNKGRLFVGQGPQFRSPRPDTPGDSIRIVIDSDGDGTADTVKTFAEGFNSIHALAWHGDDLWVANAPDLTIVRDLDADDVADQYIRLYTDLGNLEHGLHGLNWGPDGKMYMSKGNSKGLNLVNRYAPKAFRDLWGLQAPKGALDHPPAISFTQRTYQKNYHDPADDWGREGGILRCDPDGTNLEIVARGMRNPWDITFDCEFSWLGTDNDQTQGDKIFMPFLGAHFGWGHPWSAEWNAPDHPPTVRSSGPLFEGSGTGIVYCMSSRFPQPFRDCFYIGDWKSGVVYRYQPRYDGALMKPAEGKLVPFAIADGALFRPSDIEVGPDGALYVLGWGAEYGAEFRNGQQTNEGRIFRIAHSESSTKSSRNGDLPHRHREVTSWTVAELIDDLGHQVPSWRVNAQNELIRRGPSVVEQLKHRFASEVAHAGEGGQQTSRKTWLLWTIGRIGLDRLEFDNYFENLLSANAQANNHRVQAIRILAFRCARSGRAVPDALRDCLGDTEPRIRHESVLAMTSCVGLLDPLEGWIATLLEQMESEPDQLVFYSAWQLLAKLNNRKLLHRLLGESSAQLRKAGLLALMEQSALTTGDVEPFRLDSDPGVSRVAQLWLTKVARIKSAIQFEPPPGEFDGEIQVKVNCAIPDVEIRYSVDGTVPTGRSPKYTGPVPVADDVTIRVGFFRDGEPVGPIESARYDRLSDAQRESRSYATQISARSRHRYRLSPHGLRAGSMLYTDRSYRLTDVPTRLEGATYLMTANEDAGSAGNQFLSFTVPEDVDVLLAHDQRVAAKPQWMHLGQPSGFSKTALTLRSNDTSFRVYRKRFPAGQISLGGNSTDQTDSGKSNYLVILIPGEKRKRIKPTRVSDVLPLLDRANPEMGKQVFFHASAALCSKCHRIDNRGNNFAPELDGIGSRVPIEQIVQSILEPSAWIVEGFRTQVIATTDGRLLNGVVLQESGQNIRLVQTDGTEVIVARREVEQRSSTSLSAMPDNFRDYLTPDQVADIASYLFSLKQNLTTDQSPFEFQPIEGGLAIKLANQKIAQYHFADPEISRPYFAHVTTRDGIQVTRNHPPRQGDAQDHALFHPGIWMAFGDLSGADSWRLKAVVKHLGFGEFHRNGRSAGFSVRNAYLDASGEKIVCRETCRISFVPRPPGYLIRWDSVFEPGTEPLVFGDQEEMGLGVRVATPLSVDAEKDGQILDSEGRQNEREVWGNSARWCDYRGRIGRWVGLCIMPHPDNFRPSWFHARDYGLLLANPFGRNAFRKGERSRIVVAPGESLRLRYGILVHSTRDSVVDYKLELKSYIGN